MAISRNEFEKGSFPRRVYSREDHPVYRFLAKNQNQAFTIKEISKRIKMKEPTVRSILIQLIKEKLVSHKIPYWAVGKRKRK